MSVNDTYQLNECIYRLLENGDADANGTCVFSQFSTSEILDAMNRVQQKFLLDTGLIVTRTSMAGLAGISKYALPVDSIRPRRLTWTG